MWKAKPGKGPLFTSTSQNRSGFTLVEIIVVIAIIIIVASLAIPSSLRTRAQSNEAAAIGNLRTLSSAAEAYRSAQLPPAYPAALGDMITASPPYIDTSWRSGERQGYVFTYTAAADGETFSGSGTPRRANITGVRSFCVDQEGVIQSWPNAGSRGTANGCSSGGTPL